MRKLSAFTLFFFSCYLLAQSPAEKLIAEGQKSPTLEKNLRVLTDEIGGRVPGTPSMERAEQWGVDAFKAAGGENVHTEAARLVESWTEGNTQVDVVAPVRDGCSDRKEACNAWVKAESLAYWPWGAARYPGGVWRACPSRCQHRPVGLDRCLPEGDSGWNSGHHDPNHQHVEHVGAGALRLHLVWYLQ
jgi:hypothetical protein